MQIMAFHYPVLALILSTGTSVLSKSLVMEPFHHIHDFSEIERQKRQSHPAATIARYQERPSGILQREGFRDDQLVDYLTPPRPPDPLDGFGKGFGSTPSTPVLPGTVLQQSADGKWNLGYNADDVLIPPIDPYLFGPDTKYNTIQQTKTIQGGSFGSTKNDNTLLKSSLFDNFNFDKDPFLSTDTSGTSLTKPNTNNFQDPLTNNSDDSKFKPFIPSPSFPASNFGTTDSVTNGHSGNPTGHLQTNTNNLNTLDPSLNFLANSALGAITNSQGNGLRSQNFNFDTISHSFPSTNPSQNNINLHNHNLNAPSQGFVPLVPNNNNQNDPSNQNYRTPNSNFNNFPNNFQGSQNSNTDLFSNNFHGSQSKNVDVSVPFVKRQTDHNKRQIDSEEENESDNGEENDGEEDDHHKKSGPVYTFVKTDKHGHFKWDMHPSAFGSSLHQPIPVRQREQQLGAQLASPVATDFQQNTRLKSPIVVQQAPPVSEATENKERRRRQGHHHQGVTGPVHTFQKTDKHAHYKWGVRHHVGHEYAGR